MLEICKAPSKKIDVSHRQRMPATPSGQMWKLQLPYSAMRLVAPGGSSESKATKQRAGEREDFLKYFILCVKNKGIS